MAADPLSSRTAGRAMPHEDEHGRRHGDRKRLGTAQGKRLGNEFADGHVEVGDDGESDGDGRR